MDSGMQLLSAVLKHPMDGEDYFFIKQHVTLL